MAEFLRVAAEGDIPAAQAKTVEVRCRRIAVFKVEEAYHGVNNPFAHVGGPLGDGPLKVSCDSGTELCLLPKLSFRILDPNFHRSLGQHPTD